MRWGGMPGRLWQICDPVPVSFVLRKGEGKGRTIEVFLGFEKIFGILGYRHRLGNPLRPSIKP